MVEKITSDITLGETHYSNVWKVRFDTGHGGEVEFCHYDEAFAEGKEEGLFQGYEQGFEEGFTDGKQENQDAAFEEGWSEGYEEGKEEGIVQGYDQGYEEGLVDGKEEAYEEGYNAGYEAGRLDGGGAAAVYSGNFTPADNTLEVEIAVGGAYTHFVVYAAGTVTGHGVKAGANIIADKEARYLWCSSTNNTGSALSTVVAVSGYSDNINGFGCNNTMVVFNTNSVKITTSTPAGLCFGYFIAGVTYNWYAW